MLHILLLLSFFNLISCSLPGGKYITTPSIPILTEDTSSPTIRILQLGDPELRKACKSVDCFDIKNIKSCPDLLKIRSDLHEALRDFQKRNGFGRAIAAPQIGHNLQMIAMKLSEQEPAVTLYNPVIISKSKELMTLWDDCFSFPNLMVRVARHKKISVKFINDAGEEKIWNCDDDLSELLQHEIDHLHGVLAVDLALPDLSSCKSIIERKVWSENKKFYSQFVDYHPCDVE